jgi:hypothetical protein
MRSLIGPALGFALAVMTGVACAAPADIDADRLRDHVRYLVSEELQGRLTGTRGEELATAYVADQFEKLGLDPAGDDGTWFQGFDFTAGVSLGRGNRLTLTGRTPALDRDWRPLAFSRTGKVPAAPVAFAGYGISTPGYDSYGDHDVGGKWVMVFRYLPENLPTDRREALRSQSDLAYKAAVARQKGARGLVVVSGPNSKVRQELVALDFGPAGGDSGIAALSITDATAQTLLDPAGRTLADLQSRLDRGEAVPAFDIPRATLTASIDIVHQQRRGRNVIGRLPGGGGPAVVLGAHVDHLGTGISSRSLAREEERGKVHPGADDNAAGVAALIEVARHLTENYRYRDATSRHDILFAAWSGEEVGTLGSNHFVETMGDKPRAYVNMDMVGRMRDQLTLQGVGSSTAWPAIIGAARTEDDGLTVQLQDDPYIPTDTLAFYPRGIPVLNAFTGVHEDYHTPRDTADKLNYDGMTRIAGLMAGITGELATREEDPDYVERPRTGPRSDRGRRIYMGTIPDFSATDTKGLRLSGATKGGPADAAGVQPGDIIVELAGSTVGNIYDFTHALERLKVGEPAPLVVLRDGDRVTLSVTPQSRD